MPLIIKAIETFGRENAITLMGQGTVLPHTDETIDWIVDELNNEENDQFINYTFNLSRALFHADASILLPKESAILKSLFFHRDLHFAFSERLKMHSWDEATCWKELEDFCEENKSIKHINEVNLGYAKWIVESLARFGKDCEEKVLSILEEKIEDLTDNPMIWLEPMIVRLAGELRLESTIDLLIDKLIAEEDDLLNVECATALSKIGTPSVIEAIADVYPYAPSHFCLFVCDPLQQIHSELTVRTCIDLLQLEEEEEEGESGSQIFIASALLDQFALDGIEAVRQLLLDQGSDYDTEHRNLRDKLVQTCAILDERFPEYDEWETAGKADKEEFEKRLEKCGNDPGKLMRLALEKMTGKSTDAFEDESVTSHEDDYFLDQEEHSLEPPSLIEKRQKVGRNAPCPCGSGKKFKKCCINILG